MSIDIESLMIGLSPTMKQQLQDYIGKISVDLEHVQKALETQEYCILGGFAHIQGLLSEAQAIAATYYLRSYLSPFTDGYLALSTAVQHLSERRHGALIVVQRKEPLESLIHAGIAVGATLSYSLLESIFYPGGPLHDGAVLIQSNTIVSAGNVLPLSHSPTGEKRFGTRHRAAIGLTELSDSLVLVVSEETGKASFAFGGKLYPISSSGFVQ